MIEPSFERAIKLLRDELYSLIRRETAANYSALNDELNRNLIKQRRRHDNIHDTVEVLDKEISRLEEWRLETLTVATLGLPPDAVSGPQVLPVRYYVETDDRAVAVEVEHTLESLLDDCGFRAEMTYPIEIGSFFRKMCSIRRRLSSGHQCTTRLDLGRGLVRSSADRAGTTCP